MAFRRIAKTDLDYSGGVNRREFFTLRIENTKRILELSLEPLYMRYADASASVGRLATAGPNDACAERWQGEPPLAIAAPTTEALLAALEYELARADVLWVRERDWLTAEGFGPEVGARVDAFREAGGEVRFL